MSCVLPSMAMLWQKKQTFKTDDHQMYVQMSIKHGAARLLKGCACVHSEGCDHAGTHCGPGLLLPMQRSPWSRDWRLEAHFSAAHRSMAAATVA